MLNSTPTVKKEYTVKQQYTVTPLNRPNPQIPDTGLVHYNDPYQLNTVWDVLFNEAGLKKEYGASGFKERIYAVRDIVNNQYIKPIARGDFSTVGLNTLMGVGETVDVLGNIVKSIFSPDIDKTAYIDYDTALNAVAAVQDKQAFEYYSTSGVKQYMVNINGEQIRFDEKQYDLFCDVVNSGRSVNISELTLGERVKSAIGIGEYGRINYDANTESTLGNIVLEVLLDPTTWISLGATGAAKGAAKTITGSVDDIAAAVSKSVGKRTAFDGAGRAIARDTLDIFKRGKAYVSPSGEWINEYLSNTLELAVKEGKLYNTYTIKTIKDALDIATAKYSVMKGVTPDSILREAIVQGTLARTNRMTTTILNVLNKADNVSDAVQKYALKMALTPSGVYPVYGLAKKSVSTARFINHRLADAGQIYTNVFGNRTINSYIDSATNDAKAFETARKSLPLSMRDGLIPTDALTDIKHQMIIDLGEIDKRLNAASFETIAEDVAGIRKYLSDAQAPKDKRISVEDLIKIVKEKLIDNDIEDSVVKAYYDKLITLNEFLERADKHIARSHRYKTIASIDNLFDIKMSKFKPDLGTVMSNRLGYAESDASDTFIERFLKSIPTRAFDVPNIDTDEVAAFTAETFMTNLITQQLEFIDEAYGVVSKAAEAYPATVQRNQSFRRKLTKIFNKQNKDWLETYQLIVKSEDLTTKEMQALIKSAFSETAIANLATQIQEAYESWYSDIIKRFVNRDFTFKVHKGMPNIDSTKPLSEYYKELMEAEEKAMFSDLTLQQSLNATQQEAQKQSLKLINKLEELSDKLTGTTEDALYGTTVIANNTINNVPITDAITELVSFLETKDVPLFVDASVSKFGEAYTIGKAATPRWSYETLWETVEDLLVTPVESEDYVDLYNKFCAMMNSAISNYKNLLSDDGVAGVADTSTRRAVVDTYKKEYLDSVADHLKNEDLYEDAGLGTPVDAFDTKYDVHFVEQYKMLTDFFDEFQQTCNPGVKQKQLYYVTSFEDHEVIKHEMYTTFTDIITNPEVNHAVNTLGSPQVRTLLNNIASDSTTQFGPVLMDEAKALKEFLAVYDANNTFLQEIHLADISPEARSAVLSEAMKRWSLTAAKAKERPMYYINDILDNMPQYIHHSRQGNRKRSLEALMEDNEFKDSIADVFKRAGLDVPDTEAHTALSDIRTTYGVLEGLSKNNPAIKDVVDNNLVIVWDTEAVRANTFAPANELHQLGWIAYYKGEEVAKFATSLAEESMDIRRLPDRAFLYKTLNLLEDGNDPTHMTLEELKTLYAKHLSQDNTVDAVKSQNEVVLDGMKELFNLLESGKYGSWNPDKRTYDGVTLVGHNSEEFDAPYMRSLFSTNKLYEYSANDAKYGMDLSVFNRLQSLDTLVQTRKEDMLYELSEHDRTELTRILLHYFQNMDAAPESRMFTVATIRDVAHIKHFSDDLRKLKNAPPEYFNLSDVLRGCATEIETRVRSIKAENKLLRKRYIPKSVVEDPTNRSYWLDFLTNELNLTDDEITKRFGKDANNIRWSSLFGATGDIPANAYKHTIKADSLDRWFVGLREGVANKTIDRSVLTQCTSIARALDSFADRVLDIDMFQGHSNIFQGIIEMYALSPEFNYITNLRLNDLSVIEQYAVAKYYFNKVGSDRVLKDLFNVNSIDELGPNGRNVRNALAILQNPPKRTDLSIDPVFYEYAEGDLLNKTAYFHMLNKTMTLQSDFDGFSRWTDANGLIGGASTIHMRAAQPMINTMSEFFENMPKTTEFVQKELNTYDRMCFAQTKHILSLSPDQLEQWMAYEYGRPLVIDMDSILTLNKNSQFDTYEQLITKYNSEEYAAKNIRLVEQDNNIILYFDKKANLRFHRSVDDGTVSIYANGRVIDTPQYPTMDGSWFKETYGEYTNMNNLEESIKSLEFVTDNSCCGSAYELLGKDAYERLWNSLPDEVHTNGISWDIINSPVAWNGVTFNRCVLGSSMLRKRSGLCPSGRPLGMLNNATQYSMEHGGALLVYTQAMLGDASCLKGTPLESAMRENVADAAKWFSMNRDYTAVVLVADKKHKQGYKVEFIDLTKPKGVQQALDANAKIVTYSEANKLYEVINAGIFSESGLRGWQSIVRMYKIGYLFNPGTWMRNGLDAFIKNMNTSGEGAVSTGKAMAQAHSQLKVYDDIARELNDIGHGHRPSKGAIEAYFKGRSDMTYAQFRQLDAFLSDTAAGAESTVYTKLNTKSQKKYYKQLQVVDNITVDEYEKLMQRLSYNQMTNNLLAPMNYVERVSRLAAYNMLSQKGYTTNTALRMVEQTHFAYSVKSPFEQTMEMLLPFYTFASRNLNYWMDSIDKNPAYFSLLRDVLAPCLDLEDYSQEELEGNNAVQRNILSGNIPVFQNYYFNMNLSLFDSLKWLTNPLGQVDSSIFSPVQAIVDAFLQETSDAAYSSSNSVLSTWLQDTFGLKMSEQQVNEKYGEWAEEYKKLYSFRVSKRGVQDELFTKSMLWQIVPFIGSQIQRMETTGVYMNDDGVVAGSLYLLGLVGRGVRWENTKLSKPFTQAIYKCISTDEQYRLAYSNIKFALGYGDASLSELPLNVKQAILDIFQDPAKVALYTKETFRITYNQLTRATGYDPANMPADVREYINQLAQGNVPVAAVAPVVQDGEAMQYMWNSLKRTYDVQNVSFEDIPQETLGQMYEDIAKSSITLSNIYSMLSNDETTRYSYAVAKNKLGLKPLKLYQCPLDALEVIETAMEHKLYGTAPASGGRSGGYTNYKTAKKKPIKTQDFTNQYYDKDKGVYASYGHNKVAQIKSSQYQGFYKDHYTKSGKSRMELRMIPVTPENLKYRLKDMFYYYK